ncbi:MAG: OsmC family protein, partial [Solirubrobacterales bacterium]|nr:OsmC family protein [Solirubrobacterales bacterium]
DFDVVVGAGTLREEHEPLWIGHRWTTEGVTVNTAFTGGHLLHLAVAGCVLNDVFREAQREDVAIRGVRVKAAGEFNTDTWNSTGIVYAVDVDSPASAEAIEHLLDVVDVVAEIPRALRAGATVERAN